MHIKINFDCFYSVWVEVEIQLFWLYMYNIQYTYYSYVCLFTHICNLWYELKGEAIIVLLSQVAIATLFGKK